MDEKIETSSGLSSEPVSIPGLSGEKRDNEDGLEEKDSKRARLQLLDSDVLAKDVKPKASSVSKDDDRLVANALPETRIVKDVSNSETRGGGGLHVDANNNSSSVLKPTESVVVVSPRDASSVSHPPYQMSSALERAESMRQWREMKQNGFLSAPLGGPVASRPPRKPRRRGRGDSSKKEQQVEVVVDRFSNAAPSSGLLTGTKPGIIKHVRSKEQVYSVLEATVAGDLNVRDSASQDMALASDEKNQHVATAPPSGLLTGLKPGIIKHVRSKEQVYSSLEALIRNADLNVRDSARQDMASASKLPSTTVSDHAISFTDPEQAKSLAVEAATVASQWLEFLHQDLSERLSAVQGSRNRVDNTLKAELPLLVSSSRESSSANQDGDYVSLDKTGTEAHQMKWSAKFDEYKKHLHDEEKDLESSLNQVNNMQSRCNEGLRQMKEASCGKDGTNQETNLAVQAAAASIFSTCRFLLSKMKNDATY